MGRITEILDVINNGAGPLHKYSRIDAQTIENSKKAKAKKEPEKPKPHSRRRAFEF